MQFRSSIADQSFAKFGVGVVTHHFRRYCRFNVVCRGGQKGKLLVVHGKAPILAVEFRKSLWAIHAGRIFRRKVYQLPAGGVADGLQGDAGLL